MKWQCNCIPVQLELFCIGLKIQITNKILVMLVNYCLQSMLIFLFFSLLPPSTEGDFLHVGAQSGECRRESVLRHHHQPEGGAGGFIPGAPPLQHQLPVLRHPGVDRARKLCLQRSLRELRAGRRGGASCRKSEGIEGGSIMRMCVL